MRTTDRNIIIGPILIVWLIFTLSCSSTKDIYRNPYQSAAKSSPSSVTNRPDQQTLSQKQAPDWIYAVSKDFTVGYGQGRTIMEAKNAALNDIKAFIIKSLGEIGSIIEVNFVQNNIDGRNIAESHEAYLLKNHFENKYKPVINISVDRFADYYFEESACSAKYFIKYDIDAGELNRIKNDFNLSIEKNASLASRMHHVVDSLTKFSFDHNLESEVERYNTISDFILTGNFDKRDSIALIRVLQNIRIFLNTIEIRILEHNPGSYIRFGLFNGQIPIESKLVPEIKLTGVKIDTLFQRANSWELRYNIIGNNNDPCSVEIYFDLPSAKLSSRIAVEKPVIKPILEITDKIQMSDFEKDAWNGILKSLTIRMNINYNLNLPCSITSMELLIHTVGSSYPGIQVDNLNFILAPGVNGFAKTVKSDLPSRFFLNREMICDLIFYYRSGNILEKFQIKNLPVTIYK